MFFFSSQIHLKGLFYIAQILILPALLLKWNKTCYIKVFLIKIFSSRWVSSFSQSSKISFFDDDQEWTEKNILACFFVVFFWGGGGGDHKQIILCDCKYPVAQVQNSRRSKAKLIFVPKAIFLYTVNFVRLRFGPLL